MLLNGLQQIRAIAFIALSFSRSKNDRRFPQWPQPSRRATVAAIISRRIKITYYHKAYRHAHLPHAELGLFSPGDDYD